MAERHVVLGAGALGSALVEVLEAAGHRVRVGSRSGRATMAGSDAVELAKGDLSDVADAVRLCEGAQAVYLCAGPAYTEWARLFPGIYQAVLEAGARTGARLVFCENVYPYGLVEGPMTEETPLNPCSKKGELRARLNEQVLAAHADGRVQAALVRGPDYYGPGAGLTTMYGDEVYGRALAAKKANVFGDLDALHTWACAHDFAASMAAVGGAEDAMGQTWHAVCPPALTQRAMLEMIFAEIGTPMRAQVMPGFLLSMLAWFMPIMRELKEMNYQWEHDYDFRCDRIRERFGLEPTAHEEAVRATVAWFRQR